MSENEDRDYMIRYRAELEREHREESAHALAAELTLDDEPGVGEVADARNIINSRWFAEQIREAKERAWAACSLAKANQILRLTDVKNPFSPTAIPTTEENNDE